MRTILLACALSFVVTAAIGPSIIHWLRKMKFGQKILEDGLLCEKEGMAFKVYADTVVMSLGLEGRSLMKEQMEGADCGYRQVGDCQKIGNALKAFHGGYALLEEL